VPIASSTSCDQPVLVDHATDLSLSSDTGLSKALASPRLLIHDRGRVTADLA
jgi:hypothetical protein